MTDHATGTFLEVETKLDADPGYALPDLTGLPGVARVETAEPAALEAFYLDTEDLRLVRTGATLRRRTGGSDAGWHLKLPAVKEKDGRIEVRRPPGRSLRAVPPALTGLVRARLRGAPVVPVARIATSRTEHSLVDEAGAVLAVVADDDVVAEALGEGMTVQHWREIEVELVGGDHELLDAAVAALLDAGARPASVGSKLQRALLPRLAGLPAITLGAAATPAAVAQNGHAAPAEAEADGAKGAEGKGAEGKGAEGKGAEGKGAEGKGAKGKGAKGKGAKGKGAKGKGAAQATGKKAKGEKAAEPAGPTAGAIAVAHLTEQAAALVAADPRVRLDEEDAVHQMRVATRRLRSALATFRPLFAEGSADGLRAELKWLGEVLGAARDAEVMRARLRAEISAQPVELVVGPVLRRVDLELRNDYRQAHKNAVAELDGDRYMALLEQLDAFVADPPLTELAQAPAPEELRALVRKAVRRVGRSVRAVRAAAEAGDAAQHDHHLHEVRKAAKRARYAAESVRPAIGEDAKELARSMEGIQETLGDFQDSVVERVVLRDLGMRAHLAGENGFTYGRLHALAEARAKHDEELFDAAWVAVRATTKRWPG